MTEETTTQTSQEKELRMSKDPETFYFPMGDEPLMITTYVNVNGIPLTTNDVLTNTVVFQLPPELHFSSLSNDYATQYKKYAIEDAKIKLAKGIVAQIKEVVRGDYVYLRLLTLKNQSGDNFDEVGEKIEELQNTIKEKDKEIRELNSFIDYIMSKPSF